MEVFGMNFFKIKIIAIALVALLSISSCQTTPIYLTDDNAEVPEAAALLEDEITKLEDSSIQIPGSGDLLPDGVLVSINGDAGLTYLGTDGQVLSEIETPGIGFADPENVVAAGAVIPGKQLPPIIYRSWEPEQALMVNAGGQISTLRRVSSFLSIIGAPGQSAVAFSEVIISPDNFPHSFLYAGDAVNLGSAESFYDLIDEPAYLALIPVGVKASNGEPQGVWYTKTGWGIGGADLIFPITSGLYFFDLSNGESLQTIDPVRSFQGISPDLSYAGTVDFDMSGNRAMTIINLSNFEQVPFALDPTSDRGSGFSVFSPNNQFAAWMEAGGSMISEPSNFHPRVRIGDIQTGSIVNELVDAAAAQAVDRDRVTFLRPAGWLTNEVLLVEARGQDWGDVSLLRYDVLSGSLSVFSSGSFVGFGYH